MMYSLTVFHCMLFLPSHEWSAWSACASECQKISEACFSCKKTTFNINAQKSNNRGSVLNTATCHVQVLIHTHVYTLCTYNIVGNVWGRKLSQFHGLGATEHLSTKFSVCCIYHFTQTLSPWNAHFLPMNLWKFSPSKISDYTVYGIIK